MAFETHRRALANVCRRELGDAGEAEDAVQEVFIRALKYADTLDVRRPTYPWLRKIAIRYCRELRQSARRTFPLEVWAENETSIDREDGLVKAERKLALERMLMEMTPRQRRLLLLQVDGWTLKELALIDGSTLTSVGKVLARARGRAQRALESGRIAVQVVLGLGAFRGLARLRRVRQSAHCASGACTTMMAALVIATSMGMLPGWQNPQSGAQLTRTHKPGLAVQRAGSDRQAAGTSRALTAGRGSAPKAGLKIGMGTKRPDGLDPTGGHIDVGYYDEQGGQVAGAGMSFSCGPNGYFGGPYTRRAKHTVQTAGVAAEVRC